MDGDLGFERVFGGAFAAIRRNWLASGLLALPLVLAPKAALAITTRPTSGIEGLFVPNSGSGLLSAVAMLLDLLFSAAVIRATFVDATTGEADIPDALAYSLRSLLPLIGIALLSWLAMIVGLILLIVPGAIFFCMFAVAVPAFLAERSGVMASLDRSAALTKGHRWKVFGIFLLFWVAGALASGLADAAVRFGLPGVIGDGDQEARLLGAVLETIGSIFTATLSASLYLELRTLKEGGSHETLSRIFE